MAMKKIIALLSFVLFVCIVESQAQNTPVIDHRQKAQRHRIHDGVESGELTRREAVDARQDQHRIHRIERRAEADGIVTAAERAKLHRTQNKASREIRRNKHDRQDRPQVN